VVVPSTSADAVGLLRSSIREENPVLFFEHKGLYNYKGQVPEDPEYVIPLGEACIVQEGSDVTIIANSMQLHNVFKAIDSLKKSDISVEIIDPRTLDPLDSDMILSSVKKTKHAVIVHESWTQGGYGAEIAALIADKAIDYLDGPVKRVGARHVPIPFSPVLENYVLPQVEDIVNAVNESLGE